MLALPLASPSSRCLILLWLLFASTSAVADLPAVPEGFTAELVAVPPLVNHPTMGCFDDRGRLFVCESAGTNRRAEELVAEPLDTIRVLEDTDDDGVFDNATTFADKLTFPQGCLWYRRALYTCSPPNLWKLEDTDDDGVCDKRTVFVDSFGFNGNAADIHGPFLGPDGRIYWCDGRHGHEFLDEQGNLVSKGRAARIFSCKPDGSDVRTFCGGGMDNPVEIDWLDSGEMLGTVNLFYGRPRGDCLVHWVEGGVYPRYDQEDCIAEFPWTGGLLPEVHNYGHVAVSGMCRMRSNQLFSADDLFGGNDPSQSPRAAPGGSAPDQYMFFVTQFNTHKVVKTTIAREGATFRHIETNDFIVWDDPDVHPTDVLEDADGSVLVIDTGGWFRIGCPTSQIAKPEIPGAIYRIRRQGAHDVPDPRGRQLDLADMSIEEIITLLLDDPRPHARERAIDALALRPDETSQFAMNLFLSAGSAIPDVGAYHNLNRAVQPGLARTNLVWALARAGRLEGHLAQMFLQDRYGWKDDPRARPMIVPTDAVTDVTLAALEQYRDPYLGGIYFQTLITKGQPAHKRAAAVAAAQIFDEERTLPPMDPDVVRRARLLLTALKTGPVDQVLEHAVITALIRMNAADATRARLQDDHPTVRRAALIALDQMEGGDLQQEEVVALLDTDSGPLQKAALDIIGRREGWADAVIDRVRSWLLSGDMTPERTGTVRELLVAEADSESIQGLIAEGLMGDEFPTASRLVLLETVDAAEPPSWPEAWTRAVGASLGHAEKVVRLRSIAIIGRRGLDAFDERLERSAGDADLPADERIEAFAAVAPRLEEVPRRLLMFLGKQLTGETDLLERLTIARGLAAAPLSGDQLCLLARSFEEIGPEIVPVLLPAFERSEEEFVGQQLVEHLAALGETLSVSPSEVARLLERYPESVQDAAQPLLDRLGVDLEAQRERLEHLLAATGEHAGDAHRGRALFLGKQATCSSCHRVGEEGARVGPDLTRIGAIRQPRDLLEAIAFPSASFAREYRPYTVLTEEGRVYTGIIDHRTKDTLTLRLTDLTEVRIPRKTIEVLRESDTSIMPKGLDTKLSAGELADLIAFLQSCR